MESELSPEEARQALELVSAAQQEISARDTAPWWAWVLAAAAFDAAIMAQALASDDAKFVVALGALAVAAGVLLLVRLRNGIRARPLEERRGWTIACAVSVAAFMFASQLLHRFWPAAPIVLGLVTGPVVLLLVALGDRAVRRAQAERS